LPKNYWPRELGLVVNQLYSGEYTPSVDRAKNQSLASFLLALLKAAALKAHALISSLKPENEY